MVRKLVKEDQILYECEECRLLYKEKIWAERCEEFCSEHHACSIEITKHATHLDNSQRNEHNTKPLILKT